MPAIRSGGLQSRLASFSCLAMILMATGCGDGDEGVAAVPLSTSSTASSSSTSSTDTSSSTSSSSSVANPGGVVVNVDVANSALSLGGSTNMTLTFADSNGAAIGIPGTWSASSPCITASTSNLEGPVVMDQSVSFTYTAVECLGQDTVQFTGTDGTDTYQAFATLEVDENRVSYIQPVEVTPSQIAIRGTGGQEISFVTFKVGDLSSEGMAGQQVEFHIEGTAGGLTLLNSSDVSDTNGFVTARVQSGSVPALVTVVARHVETQAEAYSGGLLVATGLPLDGHFNIALSVFNPDAYNYINGQTTEVTVALTDRSGNPVLDGTTVNFFSKEGGFVAPSCKTVNNLCSVTWTPDGRDPADGRAQIFAVVKGSEYFADFNGNYIFDDGDLFDAANYDLGEPYSDNNTDGMHQDGEHFIDTDYDQAVTAPNGVWNGPNCQESALCGDRTYADLGQQTTVYMSNGRNPTVCSPGTFTDFTLEIEQTYSLGGLYLSDGNSAADNPGHPCLTGNPLPNGTKVSFTATGGTLKGTTEWVIGNATAPTGSYWANYKAPAEAGSELLIMTVETPTAKADFVWRITVTEPAPVAP